MQEALSEQPVIAGVAIASMGEAGVALDTHGQPTYPIIPWYDGARSEQQMAELRQRLSVARWHAVTGLHPNPIHTIAKWRYLQVHAPTAWARTRLWLSVADYIAFQLTGCAVSERSLAARTMAYDVAAGVWSKELLALADVDSRLLPPLVDGGTLIGQVTSEAAQLTGLAAGTPVFAGGHDHVCAALACGALTPEVLLDSLGTAEGLVLGLDAAPQPEAAGGFGCGPHVVGGHSYLMGGIYSSGGALAWLRKLVGAPDFDALRALAETVPPGATPLFVARFHGAAPPTNDPTARGALVGLLPEHGPAHLARAVYEGVVYELRLGIEALEALTQTPIQVIRMVGAMSDDHLWGRVRAAVLGRPLELARYPDMVTLGAALLAGIGANVYGHASEAVARSYQPRGRFVPEADWTARYAQRYRDYLRTAQRLIGY